MTYRKQNFFSHEIDGINRIITIKIKHEAEEIGADQKLRCPDI